MIYPWTSKDKLVLSEEGKVDENLSPVPKSGSCKKLMTVLKIVLAVEIAVFIGYAFFSIYQNSLNTQETQTDITFMSTLESEKLIPEKLNENDNIKSENTEFDSLSNGESFKKKVFEDQDLIESDSHKSTVEKYKKLVASLELPKAEKFEIFDDAKEATTESVLETTDTTNKETSLNDELENLNSETKSVSNGEIELPKGVIFKRFYFRISTQPKTESEVVKEKEDPQENSQEDSDSPFKFLLVLRNNLETKNENEEGIPNILNLENSAENLDRIVFPESTSQEDHWWNRPIWKNSEEEVHNNEESENVGFPELLDTILDNINNLSEEAKESDTSVVDRENLDKDKNEEDVNVGLPEIFDALFNNNQFLEKTEDSDASVVFPETSFSPFVSDNDKESVFNDDIIRDLLEMENRNSENSDEGIYEKDESRVIGSLLNRLLNDDNLMKKTEENDSSLVDPETPSESIFQDDNFQNLLNEDLPLRF